MATTSPDNLFKPDGSSEAQLKVLLAQMQDSVQKALNENIRPGLVLRATSAADRDAKFPNPQPGDGVYRTDLGYVQRYYGLWNATTNPNGKSPAGWYMEQEINLQDGVKGTGTTAGSATSVPATYSPIIKAGRVNATTGGSGLLSFLAYPKPFPNGVTMVTLTTLSGTGVTPVVNGGNYNQAGFQVIFPGVASGVNVTFGYAAFGW